MGTEKNSAHKIFTNQNFAGSSTVKQNTGIKNGNFNICILLKSTERSIYIFFRRKR